MGIYATNNPEACAWVLEDSRCQVAFVENAAQLAKIAAVAPDLQRTRLLAIVLYMGGRVEPKTPNADKLPPIYTVRSCSAHSYKSYTSHTSEASFLESLLFLLRCLADGLDCDSWALHCS